MVDKEFLQYLKRPGKDDNARRSNANINSDNPMGAMLQFGAASSKKAFLKDIPEKYAVAHNNGYIHIHDLDFYDMTSTCCHICLDDLFNRGFGNMRPPKRIMSAFMQLCIAIQSNQNDQYGGQSIIDYDIAMGRLIASAAARNQQRYGYNAEEITHEQIRQGCESMVHNLNTMNSRAGAQVPFSSINYGMGPATLKALGEDEASHWAQVLIKYTLQATEYGLANHETPRYPIQIYRVKKGVNAFKDDPYWFLTQEALQCTAKRAYPNYIFLDNAGNDIGFKIEEPRTAVGTMGCVPFNETIIYRDDDKNNIYFEKIGFAYEKGIDGGNYSVWDSYNQKFAKVLTWIKNPKTDDFWKVKFSNGQVVTFTSDHPLPIENKGRIFVKDIHIGDKIKLGKLNWEYEENRVNTIVTIVGIEKMDIFQNSYDVETETDRFDISGIQSHNCRTRVYTDIFGESTSYGRGNASFCTINLPRLGIISKTKSEFFARLSYTVELVADQLQYRLTRQCKRHPRAYPSLVGDEIGIDAALCKKSGDMWPMLRHFSLSIGFIGIYECLNALWADGVEIEGMDIIRYLEFKTKRLRDTRKLNYSLLATPAEGLCERFLNIDRAKFGIIPGVTDKDYYTNSFHVPVHIDCSIFEKLKKEGPYHKYCNAGHISTVEIDGDVQNNQTAMEDILHGMLASGIGYGAFNVPLDHCEDCHYDGYIRDDVCPNCGGDHILRMRRITGYLAYLDRFNDGKKAEEKNRVKHTMKEAS